MVDLALDGGLGEHLGGLLEGRGGEEGIGGEGRLGDTHEELGGLSLTQRLAGLGIDLTCGIAARNVLVGVHQLQNVDHRAGEQVGVAGFLHTHLAHHLADDDLDMLIVDVNALLTVDLQNLLNEVVVNGGSAADAQHVVRVERALLQLAALFDHVAVLHA